MVRAVIVERELMVGRPAERMPTWPATMKGLTLIALALLPFGVLVGGTFFYGFMRRYGGLQQELAIVYFIGLIILALLVGLKVTAVFFSHVGLADRNAAMGLPQGSIRAILALGLVLIFAVMAMGLFSQVHQAGHVVSSVGLTQAQLDAIPPGEIAGQRARAESGETVFDVDRLLPGSEASDDIAKQLVTILGTLVVAVSAFYFGANSSVQAAAAAVGTRKPRGGGSDGAVAITSPNPAVPLRPDGAGFAAYPIVLTTEPPGLAISTHVIGDEGGSVVEVAPGSGKFEYRPRQPGKEVLLRFALAASPGTSADLIVPNTASAAPTARAARQPTATRAGTSTTGAPGPTTSSRGTAADRDVRDESGAGDTAPAEQTGAADAAIGAQATEEEWVPLLEEETGGFTRTPEQSSPEDSSLYRDEDDNVPRPG